MNAALVKKLGGVIVWSVLVHGVAAAAPSGIPPLGYPTVGGDYGLGFGDDWPFARGKNDGRPKAHTGQDIAVTKGTPVYAAADGIVKAAFTVSDWKGCVTIEHSYSQNGEIRKYTTNYWHIVYSVGVGTVVKKGQQIGKVADLGSNSHLHFGLRTAPYSNVANRGALPRAKSDGPDDPVFPEWFRRPL